VLHQVFITSYTATAINCVVSLTDLLFISVFGMLVVINVIFERQILYPICMRL